MRNLSILIIALIAMVSCSIQKQVSITSGELSSELRYLASPELAGRLPGSRADSILLNHISEQFRVIGLKPFQTGYIQPFSLVSSIQADTGNSFSIAGNTLQKSQDYTEVSFSGNGYVEGRAVFCGFGMEINNDSIQWNEFEGQELKGKWIIMFRGEPRQQNVFVQQARDRDKAMRASDKGALGVVFVSGEGFDPSDYLDMSRGMESAVPVPVVQLSRKKAAELFKAHLNLAEAEMEIISKGPVTAVDIPVVLSAHIVMQRIMSQTGNVTAYIEGADSLLKKEWLLIGAHHDHLGMGGPGSSSRKPDTLAVHFGADDNASGVALLLELAEFFSSKDNRPARSLAFATFGAEEKGLIGSRYFTSNMPMESGQVKLMINLDMVGRLKSDSSLQIGGTGTSPGFRDVLSRENAAYGFKLSLSDAGYGPSDHASFYGKDIPVLFFSSGAHADYHTPSDHPDSINYNGMVLIGRYIASITSLYANSDESPVFTEAGPKEASSRPFRGKVTLGIMPDVSEGSQGLAVLAVTEGKPAWQAGMLKGDLIVDIDGKSISNIYDYMYRIGNYKPGDRAVVTVIRKGSRLDLLVQF